MAKCPWCGLSDSDGFDVKGNAFLNADRYQKTNLVVTACCDKPITITPLRSYRLAAYRGDATMDDWGNEINRHPPRRTQPDGKGDRLPQFVPVAEYDAVVAERDRLREALEEIAAPALVSFASNKKMRKAWRKIAVERIDIARAALDQTGGRNND